MENDYNPAYYRPGAVLRSPQRNKTCAWHRSARCPYDDYVRPFVMTRCKRANLFVADAMLSKLLLKQRTIVFRCSSKAFYKLHPVVSLNALYRMGKALIRCKPIHSKLTYSETGAAALTLLRPSLIKTSIFFSLSRRSHSALTACSGSVTFQCGLCFYMGDFLRAVRGSFAAGACGRTFIRTCCSAICGNSPSLS